MHQTKQFDLTTLSAAKLALLFNAVTTGPHVKKFESTPRALQRTLAELDKAGVTPIEAAYRAGLLPRPAAGLPAPERQPGAFEAVNLLSGKVVALRSLHDPLRRPDGAPEKAARKAADAAVKAVRVARATRAAAAARPAAATAATAAPAALTAVLPADGPARSNKTLPLVVEALRRPGGATLGELTAASGWRAPFELGNLRIAARKLGFAVAHDGAAGEARRYRIA